MRAAIYNPYLDTLGGGERYSMAVAQVIVKAGYSVDIEWKDKDIKSKLEDRFGINLSGVNFVKDIKRGNGYDLSFWVSDGSIPLLSARKNLLHFQIPFKNVNGKTLFNRMKFFRINKIICNSKFTKSIIDREYGVQSVVIYPPVDIKQFRPGKKEDLILYVGRFSQLKQSKRQDILVKAFKKLHDKSYRDWRLVLAGGSEVGRTQFVDKLTKVSVGYPIKVVENPTFNEIRDFYSKAKIFWSAAGFGVDEKKEPEKLEHFGITVIEAMSGGAVPVIYNASGHQEIVNDSINGYLWAKTSALFDKTRKLIEDDSLLKKLSQQARKDSQNFSYERFEKEVLNLV